MYKRVQLRPHKIRVVIGKRMKEREGTRIHESLRGNIAARLVVVARSTREHCLDNSRANLSLPYYAFLAKKMRVNTHNRSGMLYAPDNGAFAPLRFPVVVECIVRDTVLAIGPSRPLSALSSFSSSPSPPIFLSFRLYSIM